MNKIKIILICLLIPFFVFMALTYLKIKKKEEFQQKIVLAKETRKVLDHLMVDIYQARKGSFKGVPADGLWHHRIAFDRAGGQGVLEYIIKDGHLLRVNNGQSLLIADDIADICLRRQVNTPGIMEVRIEARHNVSLISNLRIRMRE